MKKTVATLLAAVLLISTALPLPAAAASETSGKFGELTWSLDEKGTLTIGGKGEMPDMNWDPESYTWKRERLWDGLTKKIETVIIQPGVTSIGDASFADCINLKSIDIPQTVKRIGALAFFGCRSIKTVTIPVGVIAVETGTFENCVNLTSVTIPASVKSIEYDAFDGCYTLTKIRFAGSEQEWDAVILGEDAIPEGVTIRFNAK